eukprot:scaffold79841_cov36-Prasinocladus_malaysianus.AAC.1
MVWVPVTEATPSKSPSTSRKPCVRNMLDGFTSQWHCPRPWRWCRASTASASICLHCAGSLAVGGVFSSHAARSPPGYNGICRNAEPREGSSNTAHTAASLGCRRSSNSATCFHSRLAASASARLNSFSAQVRPSLSVARRMHRPPGV